MAMIFNSPVFVFLFLPVLLSLYFLLRKELRNPLLLLASLFFYLWGEKTYIFVLFASIAGNYGLGICLERMRGRPAAARLVMAAAVALNLGLLGAFKYANFLVGNLNPLLVAVGLKPLILAPVHLPLGISFFTFHALSYVIDVYRQEVPALKSLVTFSLYISFFPQSIAGPIVRYGDVAKQLFDRVVTREGFAAGIQRFLVGMGKKMLIANTVAVPADAIFALPAEGLTAGLAWLGVTCYALQIYFDFSGYSDMAIGLAKMFGFEFRENFQHPYVATSVTDFWRRWHISLSSWFRDYLYIPVGGNRHGRARTYGNLVLVFFLCGLWHGASWTFIFWGAYHGAFLVLERAGLGRVLEAAWAPCRRVYILLVVMAGWVFFRAATLSGAFAFLGAMAGLARGNGVDYHPSLYFNTEVALALFVGAVAATPVLEWVRQWRARFLESLGDRPLWAWVCQGTFALGDLAALCLLALASAMLMAAGTYNPFIYFRF
jgi:alginate O-acetyltransferase complex protein AlgI